MPANEKRHVMMSDFRQYIAEYTIANFFRYPIRRPALVAQLDTHSTGDQEVASSTPCLGWQHSFVEIDDEIFSTVILSLPLIQEGQMSVSGKRMFTILVNRLED